VGRVAAVSSLNHPEIVVRSREKRMLDKTELGKRIKKVREDRHFTLKNIEAVAGISATHISEIERGKTSPTLGALIRIADALGKDPAYFIEAEDLGDTSLVTAENRIQESLENGAGTLERLTASIPGGRLQGCIIRLAPGKSHRSTPHAHYGNEAALVLSGKILYTVGAQSYGLGEGDSISFDAGEQHSYVNGSESEGASVLWVCTERNVT
jgi:transcriptional regulator with XRE-family HTH domain